MQKWMKLKNAHDEFRDQWNAASVLEKKNDISRCSKEMLDKILSHLRKGDKIIEAGCGLGGWVAELDERGYDIVGVDFVKDAIRTIKRYDSKLKVKYGNCLSLDEKDDTFDMYLSFGVIEHLEEGPDKFLQEASRIIKKGGKAVISVPNASSIAYKRKKNPRKYKGKILTFFQYEFSKKEFEDCLKKHGFKIIDFFYDGFAPCVWKKFRIMRGRKFCELNALGRWYLKRVKARQNKRMAMMSVAIVKNMKS